MNIILIVLIILLQLINLATQQSIPRPLPMECYQGGQQQFPCKRPGNPRCPPCWVKAKNTFNCFAYLPNSNKCPDNLGEDVSADLDKDITDNSDQQTDPKPTSLPTGKEDKPNATKSKDNSNNGSNNNNNNNNGSNSKDQFDTLTVITLIDTSISSENKIYTKAYVAVKTITISKASVLSIEYFGYCLVFMMFFLSLV
ncbi:hypothetical protein K502DRAFT_322680 [Neoconidiobolus thromboides FSU 785]|nr:hypothetical protein K502DRAFT_322680 [Neoconidiobolus thromboides FSU 785]